MTPVTAQTCERRPELITVDVNVGAFCRRAGVQGSCFEFHHLDVRTHQLEARFEFKDADGGISSAAIGARASTDSITKWNRAIDAGGWCTETILPDDFTCANHAPTVFIELISVDGEARSFSYELGLPARPQREVLDAVESMIAPFDLAWADAGVVIVRP